MDIKTAMLKFLEADLDEQLRSGWLVKETQMGASADDKLLMERIEHDFKYHAPNGEQAEKYVRIRQKAKELALLIAGLCSDSRERSTALTKLEESVMWANASIARKSEE